MPPSRQRLARCAALLAVWFACGCSEQAATPPHKPNASEVENPDKPLATPPEAPQNPDPLPQNGSAGAGPGGAAMVVNDECNKVELQFAPRVPSVFILVDRSSSMFERGLWNPLKQGVLAVVEQLDDEIRFGFSSYTGARGMQCPELTSVAPIAEHNYDAIKRAYDAISMPQYKGETPTSRAIEEVAKVLQQEPADNPKYILLVTDGEPDFCDDPNVTCSRDAVVAAAQAAFGQGIGTFIFSIGGQVDRAHLGDVANAGVGQPVEDRQMAVQYQCPMSLASYSASSGSAPFFEPDVNDQAALLTALTGAIAGARSCVFDLQGKLKIDLAFADQGVVEIDGTRLTHASADGFRMNSETQLELLGNACQQLRKPDAKHVLIDFPCKAIELL
jgi:uncharacterized protein YegL